MPVNEKDRNAFFIGALQFPKLARRLGSVLGDNADHALTLLDTFPAFRFPTACPGRFDRIVGEGNGVSRIAFLAREHAPKPPVFDCKTYKYARHNYHPSKYGTSQPTDTRYSVPTEWHKG